MLETAVLMLRWSRDGGLCAAAADPFDISPCSPAQKPPHTIPNPQQKISLSSPSLFLSLSFLISLPKCCCSPPPTPPHHLTIFFMFLSSSSSSSSNTTSTKVVQSGLAVKDFLQGKKKGLCGLRDRERPEHPKP